jgi:hypothetical protein
MLGVDRVDQLVEAKSTRFRSKRWTMGIGMSILFSYVTILFFIFIYLHIEYGMSWLLRHFDFF